MVAFRTAGAELAQEDFLGKKAEVRPRVEQSLGPQAPEVNGSEVILKKGEERERRGAEPGRRRRGKQGEHREASEKQNQARCERDGARGEQSGALQ